MRRILGYPVLAAGLVIGLQNVFPGFLERATLLTGAWDPAGVASEAPQSRWLAEPRRDGRSFSPGARLYLSLSALAPPVADAPRRSPPKRVAKAPEVKAPAPAPVTAVAAVHEVAVSPWRTAVVPVPGVSGAPGKVTSMQPQDASARYELVLNIQRELKRVGCYWGRVDGSWGAGSKQALAEFMERANAALPTSEPDYFLLSLISGQTQPICGASCPKGQALSAGGRCLPAAIVAQASRKAVGGGTVQASAAPAGTEVAAWATEVRPAQSGVTVAAAPVPPLPGRMSIGGPRPGAVARPKSEVSVALAGDAIETASIESGADATVTAAATATVYTDPQVAIGDVPPDQDLAAPPPAPRVARAPDRNRGRAQRSREFRIHGSRSVRNLFEHPLGRM